MNNNDSDETMLLRGNRAYTFLCTLDERFASTLAVTSNDVQTWYHHVRHTVATLFVLDWMLSEYLWVSNNGYIMGINMEYDGNEWVNNTQKEQIKLPSTGTDKEEVMLNACYLLLRAVVNPRSHTIFLRESDKPIMAHDRDKLCNATHELRRWHARLRYDFEDMMVDPDSNVCLNALQCAARYLAADPCIRYHLSLNAAGSNGFLWLDMKFFSLFPMGLADCFSELFPQDNNFNMELKA